MQEIHIIDSTLRDGSHAIKHQFTAQQLRDYAIGAEEAGIETLIVGHGNGLGASSLQVGESLLTDIEMLTVVNEQLDRTRLGAFLIPGFGTIKRDLKPAIETGLNVLMVACHCTEADVTRQHIEFSKNNGLKTIGVLMMSHRLDEKGLLEQAKKMQEYGADGILLMDSAGAYLPEIVFKNCQYLHQGLEIEVGFHGHNNLGMAIASSITAVQGGADFIDATTRGLGAGAGNCQLEVLVAVLEKMGYKTDLDLYKVMDLAENVTARIMTEHNHQQIIDSCSLASGIAGIFSGFRTHAIRAAREYGVDIRDIFMELGKKEAVAGQENLIVEVAQELKK